MLRTISTGEARKTFAEMPLPRVPRQDLAVQRFQNTSFYALLAAVALVPLATSKVPFSDGNPLTFEALETPKLFAMALVVGVSLASWAVALLRREVRLKVGPAVWTLGCLVAIVALSTVLAPNPAFAFFGGNTRLGALAFSLLAATLFLTSQLVTTLDRLYSVARAIAYGGIAMATVSLLQVLGADPFRFYLPPGNEWTALRGFGTLGNSDYLGTFLVGPTLVAATLALAEESKTRRIVASVGFLLTASALLITLTRGAWVGILVGLAVLAIGVLRGRSSHKRALAVAAGVLGVALVSALALAGPARIAARLSTSGGLNGLLSGRLTLWGEALQAVLRHPLLGIGPDSYHIAWFPVRAARVLPGVDTPDLAVDPHSLPLMVAVTLGVPALLLLGYLVVSTLARALSPLLSRKALPHDRVLLLGLGAALLGSTVALSTGLTTISPMLVCFTLLGTIAATKLKTAEMPEWLAPALGTVTIAVAAAMLASSTIPLVAQTRLAEAQTGDRLALTEKARELTPWDFSVQDQWMSVIGDQALQALAGEQPDGPSRVDEFDSRLRELIEANPGDYRYLERRARFLTSAAPYLDDAASEAAIEAADAAIAVSPNSRQARTQKAISLYRLRRFEQAVDTLERHWDTNLRDPLPGILYAESLLELGRRQEAREVADVLVARHPDDANVRALRDKVLGD